MTRRGRPTTGTKIQVRIPTDTLTAIDALANDHGVTRSEMIRRLLVAARALD